MGVRFAVTGGRESWIRVTLTAVGVGLGVALLLLTTAVPNILVARHDREEARLDYTYTRTTMPRADDTLVVADTDTTYHGKDVRGRIVQPEGARAPLPPGLTAYPAAGDMLVSPALKDLLASDGGKLLRERLPYRVTGTIGESGLIGSHELAYYAGSADLAARISPPEVARIDRFGDPAPTTERTDPVLLLLALVVFVVLLMPVAVFIATAVRFGGERRDRRLAALRLVGSDSAMTRRIAAGEALAGALAGLVLGTGFFLIGRQLAGRAEVLGISVFPSYLNPSPLLALLVAVAVPAAAVLVTLFALRGVVIEPLGVVRTARPARRRLWWRLLLPLGGLALLYPMVGKGHANGDFNQYLVTGGVVLLLVGVTALLPWVVESVVARLGSGGVAWQLAVRRLQLSSGTAARMVNGIAVAVAGAIALQMLFAGVEHEYTKESANDLTRAQLQVDLHRDTTRASSVAATAKFDATRGVSRVISLGGGTLADRRTDPENFLPLTVGSCVDLREVAKLPSCHDGDMFLIRDTPPGDARLASPGRTVYLDPSYGDDQPGSDATWTVPGTLRRVTAAEDPTGWQRQGVLMTRGALPRAAEGAIVETLYLSVDRSVPDTLERVRNTAAGISPLVSVSTWTSSTEDVKFTSIRTGLFVGAACVLALIGASLLVSQLEQLRERRKLLSSLVAFGTRRRTLGLSVLWQTAVPIALGLLLASAVGLALGTVLLKMTATAVTVDWASVAAMAGIGAGVVLVVTLLSLPPLLRLVRPDGLRTE
ncbi:FtsX-like permease family protein [Streptomyces sp. NPDC047000]|uniref:ABC transporter permease n=1 Tax=Streptomyces sp. NPDC047000 TaxID=3155474 RepID=UPI0034030B6B